MSYGDDDSFIHFELLSFLNLKTENKSTKLSVTKNEHLHSGGTVSKLGDSVVFPIFMNSQCSWKDGY